MEPWLERIVTANREFVTRFDAEDVATALVPGRAVITCMDPRVDLAAIGSATVRVIRTAGALSEERSLILALYFADVTELVVLMHTDCGCCVTPDTVGPIVERMEARLTADAMRRFRSEVGEPFRERLVRRLRGFDDVRAAVEREVAAIRAFPYVPSDLIVHGLVYTVATGRVDVVVDGYG